MSELVRARISFSLRWHFIQLQLTKQKARFSAQWVVIRFCRYVLPIVNGYSDLGLEGSRQILNSMDNRFKALLFSKRNLELELILPFPLVDQVTLLGVRWTSDLSWAEHFRNLKPRCSRRLYLLRVLKPVLTHDELWKVYEALIESVFLYAAPLFGELQSQITSLIAKVYRRAGRIICSSLCGCDFATGKAFQEKRLRALKNC